MYVNQNLYVKRYECELLKQLCKNTVRLVVLCLGKD